LFAVIALVADDFFEPVGVGHDHLRVLGGSNQRFAARCGVALVGILHRDCHDGAALQFNGVLGLRERKLSSWQRLQQRTLSTPNAQPQLTPFFRSVRLELEVASYQPNEGVVGPRRSAARQWPAGSIRSTL
jgi:hypothetical protein